jgi:hypothetical protein
MLSVTGINQIPVQYHPSLHFHYRQRSKNLLYQSPLIKHLHHLDPLLKVKMLNILVNMIIDYICFTGAIRASSVDRRIHLSATKQVILF